MVVGGLDGQPEPWYNLTLGYGFFIFTSVPQSTDSHTPSPHTHRASEELVANSLVSLAGRGWVFDV